MRFVFPLLLSAALLSACGLAPTTRVQPESPVAAQHQNLHGAFLAVTLAPTAEFEAAGERVRRQLGFVDVGHAQPPRDPHALHVTVGFFRDLTQVQMGQLAHHFQGQTTPIVVDGFGVVQNQAAYFTVSGIEAARQTLQGLDLRYEGDDPHVTIGVRPEAPKDVHGVPKKAQRPEGPFRLQGTFHLKQGTRTIW